MSGSTTIVNRCKANIRKMTAYGYYGFGKLMKLKTQKAGRVIQNVLYYPAVKDTETLSDLVNRISWYFPESILSKNKVSIAVDTKLLNTDLKSLVPPSSQYNYIGQSKNIHLTDYKAVNFSQADVIMLWDKRSIFEPRILWHLNKVNIVDPTYYFSVEGDTHRRMYIQTLENQQKERLSELSKQNYQSLLGEVSKCEQGYVFGTGPSLARAMEFDYRGGFRVVCNSIVKNKALLNHIKPQLLVFGDPVMHFSPCRYAEAFRQMALEAVNEFGCYIMTTEYNVPLYLAHYPELENKIIGVPAPGVWEMSLVEIIKMALRRPHKIPWFDKIPGHSEEYNFPTPDKFYTRLTGSVVPTLMVPVVSYACKKIYIIGADGYNPNERKPDETSVWNYNSSSQFGELMQTAIDTHPSFFRDQPYTFNYKIYCENFEGLLHHGESLGKRYYSLTPSYIPALAKRPVPPEKMRWNK